MSKKIVTGDVTLRWPNGQVTMQPRGAMLRNLQLSILGGELIAPLHTAPWVDTLEANSQEGLMQGLSGEWPCVPFGLHHENLPSEWRVPKRWEDPFAHGYGAHHDWDVALLDAGLDAQIDMPPDHPIRKLNRRVQPIQNGISFDLWVHPRRVCRLPIGLHPVFSLPSRIEQMHVEIEGADQVWSHPELSCIDPSPVVPNAVSAKLKSIKGKSGDLLDFSLLPRAEMSETRLLVTGGSGKVTLTELTSGVRTVLEYNSAQFPFVMLWISNRGRADPPWSNRHLALGVEPVRAAFDLGSAVSATDNPLSVQGYETAFDLIPECVFHTTYAIKVLPPLTDGD